jgi:hypothetical protein
MQPPPLALNAPPEQRWGQAELGAVRPRHGCGCILGWPTHQRLALVGFWLGLDGSHAGVLAQV